MGGGAPAAPARASSTTSAVAGTEVEDVEDDIEETYQSSVWAKSMIAALTLRQCGAGASTTGRDGRKRKSSRKIHKKKKLKKMANNGQALATRKVGRARQIKNVYS